MIKGLFETHLNVRDLERSMAFYGALPNFQLGMFEPGRRIAFYFIGGWNHTMLGLWEKPEAEVSPQHLAFEIALESMAPAIEDLKERGIAPLDFFQQPSEELTVFAWMPAAGIYFHDPDGHLLEYIARLEGEPQPERGLLTLTQWREARD